MTPGDRIEGTQLTYLGEARKVYRSCSVPGFRVRCDCGVVKIIARAAVLKRKTVSCGCKRLADHARFCERWKECKA